MNGRGDDVERITVTCWCAEMRFPALADTMEARICDWARENGCFATDAIVFEPPRAHDAYRTWFAIAATYKRHDRPLTFKENHRAAQLGEVAA